MASFLNKMEAKYKYKISFEDIMFWIIMAGLLGLALWMLSGSPTEIGAIMGIMGFVGASEIMLWKHLFKIDNKASLKLSNIQKNTTISFLKVKQDIEKMQININNRFDNMDNKFSNIENSLQTISNKLNKK